MVLSASSGKYLQLVSLCIGVRKKRRILLPSQPGQRPDHATQIADPNKHSGVGGKTAVVIEEAAVKETALGKAQVNLSMYLSTRYAGSTEA